MINTVIHVKPAQQHRVATNRAILLERCIRFFCFLEKMGKKTGGIISGCFATFLSKNYSNCGLNLRAMIW